jgi:hypothetical protein
MAIRAMRTAAAIQRGVISGGDVGPAIVLLERDRSRGSSEHEQLLMEDEEFKVAIGGGTATKDEEVDQQPEEGYWLADDEPELTALLTDTPVLSLAEALTSPRRIASAGYLQVALTFPPHKHIPARGHIDGLAQTGLRPNAIPNVFTVRCSFSSVDIAVIKSLHSSADMPSFA